MIVGGLLFRWYSTAMFKDYNVESANELLAIEQSLPYWYTSMAMVATFTVYSAGLAAWGKAMAGKKLFWLAMSGASMLFMFGVGRRAIFAMFVVIAWTLFTGRRRLAVIAMVLSIPVLIGISNVYQAYRLLSYRGVPVLSLISQEDIGPLAKQALEGAHTIGNLEEREAIWRFNYDIIKSHQEGKGELQWGKLLIGEFPNYIPAAIFWRKQVFDSEIAVEEAFGLEKVDRGSSLFTYTYADFGILGFFVAPMMMIAFIWLCISAQRRTEDPFLRLMLMGCALFYGLNIEGNYLDVLDVIRSYVFIVVLYVAARIGKRAFDSLIRRAVAR